MISGGFNGLEKLNCIITALPGKHPGRADCSSRVVCAGFVFLRVRLALCGKRSLPCGLGGGAPCGDAFRIRAGLGAASSPAFRALGRFRFALPFLAEMAM